MWGRVRYLSQWGNYQLLLQLITFAKPNVQCMKLIKIVTIKWLCRGKTLIAPFMNSALILKSRQLWIFFFTYAPVWALKCAQKARTCVLWGMRVTSSWCTEVKTYEDIVGSCFRPGETQLKAAKWRTNVSSSFRCVERNTNILWFFLLFFFSLFSLVLFVLFFFFFRSETLFINLM